jgi:hypothetical protein
MPVSNITSRCAYTLCVQQSTWGIILCSYVRFGGDYEECLLLMCGAVWFLLEPMFGGTCRIHLQGRKNKQVRNSDSSLLYNANAVPSLRILSILKMKAARSSETSVLTSTTQRHIPSCMATEYHFVFKCLNDTLVCLRLH